MYNKKCCDAKRHIFLGFVSIEDFDKLQLEILNKNTQEKMTNK